jgi:histidinol-phosphatase (PHP family)
MGEAERLRVPVDYHIHESHSADTAPGSSVESYIRRAEALGLEEVCFTTHLIIAGPDAASGIDPADIPEYLEEVERAQESTDVKLRVGLEVDYFPGEERRIEAILEEYPFDLILGALHIVEGCDLGYRHGADRFFSTRSMAEAIETYFRWFMRAAESGLFDVMAHPDYFRRYLPLMGLELPTFEEYGSQVLEALEAMRGYSVGFEINSSGYRHGIEDCYPILGFTEAARRMGIEVVTIGSDSHRVEDLGRWLNHALETLVEGGYEHLYTYQGRKARPLSIR